MGPDGPGLNGPRWPGPKWAQMARAQMGPDGPGPKGPRWPGPKRAQMARAQMGQDGLGPHGPKWGPGPHGGSGFVEEWPSHKGSGGTQKGKWIPRPSQTLWLYSNPPNPPRKTCFPGNPTFSQVPPLARGIQLFPRFPPGPEPFRGTPPKLFPQ